MSFIIENDTDIVDRDNEVQQILKLLNHVEQKSGSHIIALCADTGYGKSSVMIKAAKEHDSVAKKIIIVETPPANCAHSQEEGSYIHYIASAIDKKAKFRFEDFLYSGNSRYQSLIDADTILTNGLSIKSALVTKIGFLSLADLFSQRALYDNNVDSILLLKDYISVAIAQKDLILDITNAQNIDARSYHVIRDIIQTAANCKIVMEWTTQHGETDKVVQFLQPFSCKYTLVKIDVLPFEFALRILGVPATLDEILEAEQFYNNIVQGNLYKIVQAKMDADEMAISYENDPVSRKIAKLKFLSKMLLGVLCLHDGMMPYRDLEEFYLSIGDTAFNSADSLAELKTLVANDGNNVWIRHASIIDSFLKDSDNACLITAYKFLVTFYNARRTDDNSNTQNQAIIQLVRLHSRFEPERMLPLLTHFKNIIINQVSEDEAFSLISKAFHAITKDELNKYRLLLINLCYEAGLYRGALELASEIDILISCNGNALFCMLLNRNDNHAKAIQLCKNEIRGTKNLHYKLILLMIKMLSERSLNQENECLNTFRQIEKGIEFQVFLEYGFFLRNAQIVKSYSESLSYLEKSIAFFEARNEAIYAAHSKLTYLIQLARLGQLESSEKQLNQLADLLLKSTFEKHIVYCNQAAIQILSGRKDDSTNFLLEKALLTATTVFDRIVILNNMLCLVIANGGSKDEFYKLEKQLTQELINEPDEKLRLKTYTNFFLYHRFVSGSDDERERWHKRACLIAERIKSNSQIIERVFLFGETPAKDLNFLASHHFCISFITYWHFAISQLDT